MVRELTFGFGKFHLPVKDRKLTINGCYEETYMHKQDAIAYFGGIPHLAKALGIGRHAIYQWPDIVPELRARQLAELTEGQLKFDPSLYSKSQAA